MVTETKTKSEMEPVMVTLMVTVTVRESQTGVAARCSHPDIQQHQQSPMCEGGPRAEIAVGSRFRYEESLVPGVLGHSGGTGDAGGIASCGSGSSSATCSG